MKTSVVAKIAGISDSYVSKIKHGKISSGKNSVILDLVALKEEEFISLLQDERMNEVCKVAVARGKTVAIRNYAALLGAIHENVVTPVTERSRGGSQKIFDLIALSGEAYASLIADPIMIDVCDTAILRAKANGTRIYASLVRQVSLKLQQAGKTA